MTLWEHPVLRVKAVSLAHPVLHLLGLPVGITPVMVVARFVLGVLVGATPGLAGPLAMALPLLISAFGYMPDALLPVLGA